MQTSTFTCFSVLSVLTIIEENLNGLSFPSQIYNTDAFSLIILSCASTPDLDRTFWDATVIRFFELCFYFLHDVLTHIDVRILILYFVILSLAPRSRILIRDVLRLWHFRFLLRFHPLSTAYWRRYPQRAHRGGHKHYLAVISGHL